MFRMLLLMSSMLYSCAPAPQKAAMPGSSASAPSPDQFASALGQTDRLPDTPAEARGRQILSTAFVMMGPDGHMTVELHDGRVMVLRAVVMNPTAYCGVQVPDDAIGPKFCGIYADVAAARPGGGPVETKLGPS